MDSCPICRNAYGGTAKIGETSGHAHLAVDCEICGRFVISREAYFDYLDSTGGNFNTVTPVVRALIAHKIRTSQGGRSPPLIVEENLHAFVSGATFGPSPSLQAANLLRFVGEHVIGTGQKLKTMPLNLYAEIGAPSPDMAIELAMELIDRGLLTGIDASSMSGKNLLEVNLTLSGWENYEQEMRGLKSGNYAFLALKFGDEILDTFIEKNLKPSIADRLGYKVVDMRDISRAGVIDNILRAQIRDALFVLVDLTHDNFGAYWEAGYAEGLGKPVIYICERTKFEEAKTHFDTNHCTTVLWQTDDPQGFCDQLVATIRRSLNLFESA